MSAGTKVTRGRHFQLQDFSIKGMKLDLALLLRLGVTVEAGLCVCVRVCGGGYVRVVGLKGHHDDEYELPTCRNLHSLRSSEEAEILMIIQSSIGIN